MQPLVKEILELRELHAEYKRLSEKLDSFENHDFDEIIDTYIKRNKVLSKMNRLGSKAYKVYKELDLEDRQYLIDNYGCKDICKS